MEGTCAFCGGQVRRLRANGRPFKFCTADCDKAAMAMRSMKLTLRSQNPFCSCGCGQEVARPWNRYVHGHAAKAKLTSRDVRLIKELLERKTPQALLAKVFGVSQATICKVRFGAYGRPVRPVGREVVRLAELKTQRKMWEEIKWLRQGKAELKKVKSFLRRA